MDVRDSNAHLSTGGFLLLGAPHRYPGAVVSPHTSAVEPSPRNAGENGRAYLSVGAGALLSLPACLLPGTAASVVVGTAALALLANGIRLLRHPRSLTERVVRVADRVEACAPEGHRLPPFQMPSAYGLKQDIVRFLEGVESGARTARRQRKITARLWQQVREVIEELGRSGHKDYALARYLAWDGPPEAGQCAQLSAALYYAVADHSSPTFV